MAGKSGAEAWSLAWPALGVCVAMRVYAGSFKLLFFFLVVISWMRQEEWEGGVFVVVCIYSCMRVNSVSAVFQILTVLMSEPTMSSRCVVMARPSISGPEPGSPTRSVMSKMMLVKPSLSIQTSWLSGTCLSLLRKGRQVVSRVVECDRQR